jgi:methionyl-tRNA formyltransferase
MRIIFMGTPPFAATALSALIAAGHDIICVYAQPPRAAQRGKKIQKSAVQVLAEHHDIPVRTPTSLRDAGAQQEFAGLNADIAVVAAYGMILPQAVLDMPKHGCLNIHASLLPRWRGAAPIHRAIEAGDTHTGVCIMRMEAGLDTGPIILRRTIDIAPDATTGTLLAELADLGGHAIVEALSNLHELRPEIQSDDGITYAKKIDKAEARLDFTQYAKTVEQRIRAFNPAPGAFIELNGERIKVLRADVHTAPTGANPTPGVTIDSAFSIMCGDYNVLRPTSVQRAGKTPVNTDEFLRGFPVPAGTIV